MKKFEGTATVRSIDDILADTDAVRAKDAEIAALRAQLAAAEQRVAELEAMRRWQPVDDATIPCICEEYDCSGNLEVEGGLLQIEIPCRHAPVRLPDGWAVCKRVAELESAAQRAQLVAAEQRVAELESAAQRDWVDWSQVPTGYNWVAAGGSGAIYAFVAEPQFSRYDWLGGIYCQIPGELPFGIDWRQSLRRRP